MPRTPRRTREPHPEGMFPSEVVARNVASLRVLRGLQQKDLVERMNHLGHRWNRATPSEVERRERAVTVDELASLCVALNVTPSDLLDPERLGANLDLGMTGPVPRTWASQWARGLRSIGLARGDEGQLQYSFEQKVERLSDEARLEEQFRSLLAAAEDRERKES
jgi:transcriptional regulator with XRE-family HTH domain